MIVAYKLFKTEAEAQEQYNALNAEAGPGLSLYRGEAA
jgi:hypothetical protein